MKNVIILFYYIQQTQREATYWAVIDLFPLISAACQVLTQAFEMFHRIQAAYLIPRLFRQPGARIGVGVVQAHTAR